MSVVGAIQPTSRAASAATTGAHILVLQRLIEAGERSPDESDWRKAAIPWYSGDAAGSRQKVNRFPREQGVYVIVRQFAKGAKVNSRVLYVGMSRRGLRANSVMRPRSSTASGTRV